MYISVYDVGMFILFILALVVSGFFIAVLRRAFCVLGYVKRILEDHTEDINATLSALPIVLDNINALAVRLKETADQTTNIFGFLQDNVTDTVDELRDGWENIAMYAKIIGEVVKGVFSKS